MSATRIEEYVPQRIRLLADDCDRACTSILRDLADYACSRDDAAMLLRLEVTEAFDELQRLMCMWLASAA